MKSSTYAVANLKRVVPNLVAWTTRPGEDYEDLTELYGETLGLWALYMGHAANVIGGVHVELKTADQTGAVYRPLPRARQRAALEFVADQALRTPSWLAPEAILSRVGPGAGATSLAVRQATVLNTLLSTQRLARMAEAEALGGEDVYAPSEFMADVRRHVWGTPGAGAAPDANRRQLQRVYIERLAAILTPPAPPPAGAAGQAQQQQAPPSPLVAPVNVQRTDLPALARAQLRAVREEARRAAASTTGLARAHWQDVADRVDAVFEVEAARR